MVGAALKAFDDREICYPLTPNEKLAGRGIGLRRAMNILDFVEPLPAAVMRLPPSPPLQC